MKSGDKWYSVLCVHFTAEIKYRILQAAFTMPVSARDIAPVFPASEIAGLNSRWDTSRTEFQFYFLLQSLQVNVRDYAGTGLSTRIVITDFFLF